MAEYAPVSKIPWDMTQFPEESDRRRHFVQVLRTIQYGASTSHDDVAMFRKMFSTETSMTSVLVDPRSKMFAEALFYHVAVFETALDDIEGFINTDEVKPGSAMEYDLVTTLEHTRTVLSAFSQVVTALQRTMGIVENPFKDGKFVGVLAPTAAPRELLLSMIWTLEFRKHNSSALEKGQILTETDLKATLGSLSKYPNFEELKLSTEFGADPTHKSREDIQLSNGIPRMFFICVGSATASATGGQLQHVKIGATTPVWYTFPEFQMMCRVARESRFGPDKISKLNKAVDTLTAFEAKHYEPVRERLEKEAGLRSLNKKKLTEAKKQARQHAINTMQAGHPDFIDHLQEIGQAYSAKSLAMNFACYCCQGIFGYHNVLKEASEDDIRNNLTRWVRSKDGNDHLCAEAVASLLCKAVAASEPYEDSLPYA